MTTTPAAGCPRPCIACMTDESHDPTPPLMFEVEQSGADSHGWDEATVPAAVHFTRSMDRVKDATARTDDQLAELESAAERARKAFPARPGPARTDGRPAWQSPYGPPHRH